MVRDQKPEAGPPPTPVSDFQSICTQILNREEELRIPVSQKINADQLFDMMFKVQCNHPEVLYVKPRTFVWQAGILKIQIEYELSQNDANAFREVLAELEDDMRRKYDAANRKSSRELVKTIYETLVLHMRRDDKSAERHTLEYFLYGAKTSSVNATLLHYFLRRFCLTSQLIKLTYNKNYVHYTVQISLSDGESFLLDPTFEYVVDGEVWFRYFLLNRAQIVELRKSEYDNLNLELFSRHIRADCFVGMEVFSFTDYPLVAEKITREIRDRTFVRLPKSMMENMPDVLKQLRLALLQKTQTAGELYEIQTSSWLDDLLLITFRVQKACACDISQLPVALQKMVAGMKQNTAAVLKAVVTGVNDASQLNGAVSDFTHMVNRPAECSYVFCDKYCIVDVVAHTVIYSADDPVRVRLNQNALRYHSQQQEPRIQQIIERMLHALLRLHRVVYFARADKFQQTEIKRCQDVILMDYPELWFVICQKYYSLEGYVTQIELFEEEEDVILEQQRKLWAEVDKGCAPVRGQPELQREYFVSSLLRHTVVYDKSVECIENTAFGALVLKRSVCQGISCAFKLLSETLGIPCITIFGQGDTTLHSWNQVCVEGVWYNVDPTWNQDFELLQYWFNVDDRHFFKSHRYTEYFGVTCSSMEHNLHQLKGCRISGADIEEIQHRFVEIVKAYYLDAVPRQLYYSVVSKQDILPTQDQRQCVIWFDTLTPVDAFYKQFGQKLLFKAGQQVGQLLNLTQVYFLKGQFLRFQFDYENMDPIETTLAEPIRTDCKYLIKTAQPFRELLDQIKYKYVRYWTYPGYVLAQFSDGK